MYQNVAELLRRYIKRQDADEEYFDTWQIEDKEIKKQSFWMIKDLKIKDNKETWNQASGVQVRGGLLGYKRSRYFCMSKYCCMKNKVKVLLKIKVKVLLFIEEILKYFEGKKDLCAILVKGLMCNIERIF